MYTRKPWLNVLTVSIFLLSMGFLEGCTPEQADAVLAGIEVTADQLSEENDGEVSFRDWLASEFDD